MSDLEMTLLHVVGGAHIGYGRMGVYLAKEMREKGITVYDSIADAPETRVLSAEVLEKYGNRDPGITNVIAWASVPTHARGWWEGQVPIILTMWETTHLPEQFRENIHEFDTVIVPSQQNKELFSRFHKNVKYIPLGIDPVRWAYRERQEASTRFNFLIAGTGERKGTDLAVKAFRAAFPEGSWPEDYPVPYLVMKGLKPEDFYGDRIERISGRLSGEEEANLYATAHCYLQPSRGEGFGLQPLQAIAQGIPTILTDAHGQAGFASLGMGLSSTLVKAGYFIYGAAGEWWEPDFDELVDTMRWVYYNYEDATRRAYWASSIARRDWTWERSAEKFVEAIGPERMGPYEGIKRWHIPQTKLFKVVTNCDTTSDIGGNIYVFEKGVEQYQPADVKRILFESGKLDPSCMTGDDTGLLPEQVAKVHIHTVLASFCPTCHQKLGSGYTMADEIMAGRLDPETLKAT
jgi:glycosyltransferase involved in cell wall biosynthesis